MVKNLCKICMLCVLINFISNHSLLFAISQCEYQLYPIEKENTYGYINNKGDVVIEPKFEFGDEFSDGMAIITPLYKKSSSILQSKKGNYSIFDSSINFSVFESSYEST